jgi:hypothetical protein
MAKPKAPKKKRSNGDGGVWLLPSGMWALGVGFGVHPQTRRLEQAYHLPQSASRRVMLEHRLRAMSTAMCSQTRCSKPF